MKKFLNSVVKYFLEFSVVAFGVFLGLYVSELRSEEKLTEEKQEVLSLIIQEMETNLERIRAAADYHLSMKSVIDSLNKNIDGDRAMELYFGNSSFQHNDLPGWRGVKVTEPDFTAFESAKISGILKEFDIETISKISRTYNFLNTYSNWGQKAVDKMVQINSSSRVVDMLFNMGFLTSDILEFEKAAIKITEKTIEELKAKPVNS
ncbi:MAG: hypothetical protein WBA74_02630 [Cyclobacteriaceae bacterium]